jgi:hypothetical protein
MTGTQALMPAAHAQIHTDFLTSSVDPCKDDNDQMTVRGAYGSRQRCWG